MSQQPDFYPLPQKPPAVEITTGEGGALYLRSRYELVTPERSIVEIFRQSVAKWPERNFIAERAALPDGKFGEWQFITYAQMDAKSDAIAQSLLDRGLGPDAPLMVLSGNSILHGILMLGAYKAGVPIAPVSVGYSLSSDQRKLRHVVETVKPKVIFVERGVQFVRALEALDLTDVEVVSAEPIKGFRTTPLSELLAAVPTKAVADSIDQLGHDTVLKYIFTSGSTGMPKGVITTHGSLCSVLASYETLALSPPGTGEPMVTLEWMPWSHIAAGNTGFNRIMRHGGTLYLDSGKPQIGHFEETLRNLRGIRVTNFSSVPLTYLWLCDVMEKDAAFRDHFFSGLKSVAYASAAMAQDLYDRLQALSIASTGKRIPITTVYGATETQGITTVHWHVDRVGYVGLPLPGTTIKLVPNGGKREIRVKGPTITRGYFKRPDLTEAAFDAEGFYKLGDAGRFVDESDPAKGILFDGRVTEDFKLDTGTWVSVGPLRGAAIEAASPLIQDLIVCAPDRGFLALMIWPNLAAARNIAGKPDASMDLLVHDPKVISFLKEKLAAYNKANPASSRAIRRVALLVELPSIDGHEITDKGYINQRATLDRRAAIVAALYRDPPPDDVIVIS